MLNERAAIRKFCNYGGYGSAVIKAVYVLKGVKANMGLHYHSVTYAPRINRIVTPDTDEAVLLGFQVDKI